MCCKRRFHDEFAPGSDGLHAAVTLASLVEKETPDPAERPVVAGVFTRRLEKHMLLQCDPTVIYAARLADRPIGTIHASDLEVRFAVQYLSPWRLAAGADCQSGRKLASRRLSPGRRQRALFREQ